MASHFQSDGRMDRLDQTEIWTDHWRNVVRQNGTSAITSSPVVTHFIEVLQCYFLAFFFSQK